MIGDPSGRSDERNLLDEATLRANVAAIKAQITRIVDCPLVDNYDWTRELSLLGFLRDVGKHATVASMLARESVKQRMSSEAGISFTEFSYMLLQANDYLWLHDHEGCTLQVGGSDQWGNILSGVDLIRRTRGGAVHALCWPLLTAPDGSKLGKSTGARVWLDPRKTSPYELFQHWLRRDDAEVERLLLWFTLLPVEEVAAIVADHATAPEQRRAQRRLALEVTALVHGPEAAAQADQTSAQAFGAAGGDRAERLAALEGGIPTTRLPASTDDRPLVEALVEAGLAASKSAAARLLRQGGVSVNDERISDEALVLTAQHRVDGRWTLLQVGKKQRHLLVFEEGGGSS